jgi:hypothetical protein
MIKTFISHSSLDDKFVDYISEKLRNEQIGLDIFVDHEMNMIGDNPQNMIDEVRDSVIFIIVISRNSIENKEFREFIGHEFEEALKKRKKNTLKIFPIKLEIDFKEISNEILTNFDEEGDVNGILYGDFSNEMEIEKNYSQLFKAIYDYCQCRFNFPHFSRIIFPYLQI